MSINIELSDAYGQFEFDINVTLPEGGVTTFFGPSGAGKSTILRCIAGLTRSKKGYISVCGDIWQDEKNNIFLPPYQRELGYVFQEPRLFSHLTVRENLEYGLKRTPAKDQYVDWHAVIEILDIQHLLQRMPEKLSGGEQQRVAIGRALLASPKLLLMDEPLASLDQSRKQEVLPFIRALHREISIPIFYVTHALTEILQIADNIVLIENGRVLANGALHEVFSNLAVSSDLGEVSGSVIEATVEEHDNEYGLTCLSFKGGKIYIPGLAQTVGAHLRVHVLAKNVGIALQKPQETTSFLNIFEAKVVEVGTPDKATHSVQVKLDIGVPLLACISRKSIQTLHLEPGMKCFALVKAVALTK